jgi:hypothetical protein
MARVGRYRNPTINVDWHPERLPEGVVSEPVVLPTPDRASTTGTLYLPPSTPHGVVAIMHPRVDCTHHYLIPPLLRAGYAVWGQRSRWVNNDVRLVHEQVLIDIATAHTELEARGLGDVFLLGNSGGASLYCLYIQQASKPAAERLADDSTGAALDLDLSMPMPRGLVLLAPHPGQGDLLQSCIDPSVTDESDGVSIDPSLDMFDEANGFAPPPESSSYGQDFLDRYRAAQRARVERIDTIARAALAEQRQLRDDAKARGDATTRRRSLVPRFMVVYRTDADPRCTDLSLDPSDRSYGSLFGVRPDVTNYGPVGFARLTSPEAWLSTWSATSTRAAIRLTGPDIDVPTLIVRYTGDHSVFPGDVDAIRRCIASRRQYYVEIQADHYGYRIDTEDRSGGHEAAQVITEWMAP